MEALMSELHGSPMDAVMVWDEYLQALPATTPDYALRRALVLRRQEKLSRELPWDEHYNPDGGLHRLLESVELDPDDRQTWLDIIERSRKVKSANEAYKIVNQAVARFPDDVEFLLKAIEATSQRGAFKKAAQFADHLLEIDPINTRGKELLTEAHIAHGHKLCRQKKYALAEKEFLAAGGECRNRFLGGRALICLGLLAFLQKKRELGEELLEKSKSQCSSPLMRALLTSVEARLMQCPKIQLNAFDKSLREVSKEAAVAPDECYDLAIREQNSRQDESQSLQHCFRLMKTYFSRAAALSWSPGRAGVLAESWYATSLYPQLKKLASAQLRANSESNYFRFMEIVAISKDGVKPITREVKDELWEIQDEAWYGGDYDFASRIEAFQQKCRLKITLPDNEFEDMEIFKIPNQSGQKTIDNSGQGNKPPFEPGNQLDLLDFLLGDDE